LVKLNGISAAEDSAYEAEEEKANDAESPAPSQMGYKIANALKDILEASLDEDAENKALADQEAAEEALKELERRRLFGGDKYLEVNRYKRKKPRRSLRNI